MIARVWRGWTLPEDADRYERLLREEILPEIASRDLEGYRGSKAFRRPLEDEVEFMTILRFESMAGIRQFAGEEPTRAHIPDEAERVLCRYDERAKHYESLGEASAPGE